MLISLWLLLNLLICLLRCLLNHLACLLLICLLLMLVCLLLISWLWAHMRYYFNSLCRRVLCVLLLLVLLLVLLRRRLWRLAIMARVLPGLAVARRDIGAGSTSHVDRCDMA